MGRINIYWCILLKMIFYGHFMDQEIAAIRSSSSLNHEPILNVRLSIVFHKIIFLRSLLSYDGSNNRCLVFLEPRTNARRAYVYAERSQ